MLRKIEKFYKKAVLKYQGGILAKAKVMFGHRFVLKFVSCLKKFFVRVTDNVSFENNIVILENKVISASNWKLKSKYEQVYRIQNVATYSSFLANRQILDSQTFEHRKFCPYRITVISSIYRPGKFFDSFLGNLLEQTIFSQTEFVLVLVDPIDSELQIAKSFVETFPNVRLEIEKSRISIYDAWNRAILQASSAFITNMNVDDIRSPDSLEKQVSFMENHKWADVGYADFYYLLDKELDWTSIENIGERSNVPPASLIGMACFGINPPHNGPIWRRDLHDRFGLFDEKLKSAGDYEFWMRIISMGACFLKMPETTIGYFLNPNGMSTNVNSPSTGEENDLQIEYRRILGEKIGAFKSTSKIPLPSEIEKFPWLYADVVTEDFLNYLGGKQVE
jgi:glycosyltransferase involved in cell wall biosynthesis